VTPAAGVSVGQPAAALASASPTIASAAATTLYATIDAAATLVANTADAQATAGGGLASPVVTAAPVPTTGAPAATTGPTASPTAALIVVANVDLVPAPTVTTPPVTFAVVLPKPTTVPAPKPTEVPVVAVALPTPTVAAVVAVAPPVSADAAAGESYTVDLINAQRAALGLAALSADPTLMGIANSRVADMVARGYTGHNDPVTGVALGPALMMTAGFHPVGENWYGSRLGPPSIADVAMKWFMTDAPHYQNILNPRYTGVGVGIAYNGMQWLLVQDFAGS
jgi:uncharacterized protein YkwD